MNIKIADFEKIYRETYNHTLKFIIIKCNNLDDVNDILQDTYLELLKKLKYKKIQTDNLDGFICGIANNVIKRHYFKKAKITYLVDQENENIDVVDDFDLELDFITKENAQIIWKYVKSRDLLTAKIFNLYFALDMKITDISKELNLDISNVKNRIYRTLRELRKEVKENE